MAAARTAIRVYKFRQVFVDDYFLFLAVATLIASTIIFFWMLPSLYAFAAISAGLELLSVDYIDSATKTANVAFAAEVLAWTTLFAVKFSFLFFFRNLIRRLRDLEILWWCVLVICVPVAVVCICLPFIECPYVGKTVLGSFSLAYPFDPMMIMVIDY